MKFLNRVLEFFARPTIDDYLNKSKSHQDLEQRFKDYFSGKAGWY